MLISYLSTLPVAFGFSPRTPFMDIDLALAMLSLPSQRRKNRQWQKDFFHTHGLDLENMTLKPSFKNTLIYQGMKKRPLRPLAVNLLNEVVKPDYVEWINKRICTHSQLEDFKTRCFYARKLGGLLRKIGFEDAYSAYLILKPIENLIRKRNQHNG